MNALLRRGFWLSVGVVALGASLAAAEDLPKKFTEAVPGARSRKLSFEMVLIPGGKFILGSPDGENGRKANEGPAHEAALQPFYLATTETTLDLFLQYYDECVSSARGAEARKPGVKQRVEGVTGPTPVYGDMSMGWGTEARPAIGISWLNTQSFCKWLQIRTGKPYRLPTEAEWEYACRAGSKTAYPFGDDPAQLGDYAWFKDNSDCKTHPVAQKKPNAWGLHDMVGNVREWVQDFYAPDTYAANAKSNPAQNPTGPKDGKVKVGAEYAHVARGGDWDGPPEELRSATRGYEESWWRDKDPQDPKSDWWLPEMAFIGFRVALSADGKAIARSK